MNLVDTCLLNHMYLDMVIFIFKRVIGIIKN